MTLASRATTEPSRKARTAPRDLARAAWPAVAALTLLGFVLRVVGMDQSLFNDERFTHAIVTQNGLLGAIREVYDTSVTPPLHYVLAWFAVQLPGDTTVTVRLPSLVFGTAMIPLLFLLARRTAGVRAGILAAAVVALSPFAIYYSNEARTYEVMVFLVALSTVALLRAVEPGVGRRGWWAVYAASSCLAMYAHYTAIFVLTAQFAWAARAHRERLRPLLIAEAAAVVGYLPWVPGYVKQRGNSGVEILNAFSTDSLHDVFQLPLRMLIGHPFRGLADVPGTAGLVLVLGVAALALAAALRRRGTLRPPLPSLRSERALVLILAVATPAGLLLYAAVGPSLYGARNLSASQPALFVLIALVLDGLAGALPRRVAAAGLAGLVALLGVIAVASVGPANHRPPYREVARYLDGASGSDPIIEGGLLLGADKRLGRSSLATYFKRKHRVYFLPESAPAWRRLRAGGRVYVVAPQQPAVLRSFGLDGLPADLRARRARIGGLDGRALSAGSKTFAGFYPIVVQRFRGLASGSLERRGGQEVISWSFGRSVTVTPGVTRGSVEGATAELPTFGRALTGWAVGVTSRRPPDWVLLFSRGQLLSVSAAGDQRPDIAKTYGQSALPAGFKLASPSIPRDPSALRVFAMVGRQASELPISDAAKEALRQPSG